MSGSNQTNSDDSKDCHHDKSDPVAALAGRSISGERRPPLLAAHRMDSQVTTDALTKSIEYTDARVKPTECRWDGVLSEEGIGQFGFLSINQEEHEPNTQQEVEKLKPRRGGVMHRSENDCCPVLPLNSPLPPSHRRMEMEDIRALDRIPLPKILLNMMLKPPMQKMNYAK